MMRVIAGEARRLLLKTPKGDVTRPTADMVKETLFNMLSFSVEGARFLDLFAGSGGIGIEALSRGALEAVFVDNSKEALDCMEYNLAHTRLRDRARVLKGDAVLELRRMSKREGVFDIIFMDPPYHKGLERECLDILADSPLADEKTLVIVEADKKMDPSGLLLHWNIDKIKQYKNNQHLFLHKKS